MSKRRCRLLYVPVFIVDYTHGELFNEHGERSPQRFQALLSGLGHNSISAERHFSPHKVLVNACS